MKVGDLILALQECDPDADVTISCDDGQYEPEAGVRLFCQHLVDVIDCGGGVTICVDGEWNLETGRGET